MNRDTRSIVNRPRDAVTHGARQPVWGVDGRRSTLQSHFLGEVPLERYLALQERLLDRMAARGDSRITLLACEHPRVITLGRDTAPGDVRFSNRELASLELESRAVDRGGGALLHQSGQLALYCLLSLNDLGLSPGDAMDRLHAGLGSLLRDVDVTTAPRGDMHGLWSRTGQLVHFGGAVRRGLFHMGAYVNVYPDLRLGRRVTSMPWAESVPSSLVVERRAPMKMTTLRARLMTHLSEAFGCQRYSLHTGHPLLAA